MVWEKVESTIGQGPAEMSSHACTAINEKLVFFGGTKDNVFYNNLYVLDTGKHAQ
jgi:hypothetical protein